MRATPEPVTAPAGAPTADNALIYPLDELYTRAGLPLPRIEFSPGWLVPEPYKSLLVHNHDMTPTLEAFYRADIHLEIISRHHRADAYLREVILRLERNEMAVEFGANKIHLARFPQQAQALILGEQLPLGRILKDCDVRHRTEARAFLRVASDALMATAFGLREPTLLYGRKAVISNLQGQPLSEIVEVLPPAARIKRGS